MASDNIPTVPPAETTPIQVLSLLAETPHGRSLLETAKQFWRAPDLSGVAAHLKWGDVSRTDAVLTRHYDSLTGQEIRERVVNVYLKKGQPIEELALDLAHELVHATTRPDWDPYDPELTASSYIRSTIEGPGGEVKAVMSECEEEYELSSQRRISVRRCKNYRGSTQAEMEAQITQDFYRSGTWAKSVMRELGDQTLALPLLSAQAPALFSSTGNAPYPWALLKEYRELSQMACENTLRRVNRTVASDETSPKTREFLAKRCNLDKSSLETGSSLAIRH